MSKVAPLRKKELSALRNDRKFGTDGIRGPVTSTMNPLFVTKLGWAAGCVLKEEGITKVLIGKTRAFLDICLSLLCRQVLYPLAWM